jgi:hypothetical protein
MPLARSPSRSIIAALLRVLAVVLVLGLAGAIALAPDHADAAPLIDPAPPADQAAEDLESDAVAVRGGEVPAAPRCALAIVAPRIPRPGHAPTAAPPVPPPER